MRNKRWGLGATAPLRLLSLAMVLTFFFYMSKLSAYGFNE